MEEKETLLSTVVHVLTYVVPVEEGGDTEDGGEGEAGDQCVPGHLIPVTPMGKSILQSIGYVF